MNIFFGKISKKVDVNQITEGYYTAEHGSTWFADIQIDDYAFIIGGDKIQLWRAKEWSTKNGKACLFFDIINNDIGIILNKFVAIKNFLLTPALIVLTSRSARFRAFFKIELVDTFDIDLFSKSETYTNESLYRDVTIHQSKSSIINDSKDIQFYYENGSLKLYHSSFIASEVIDNFKDNLSFGGKGAVRKDNVIKLIKSKKDTPFATITNNELSIRSLYDTLFCEYDEKLRYFVVGSYWDEAEPQDQTERFVEQDLWENGYSDKFLDEVNDIPVNSKIAIKSVYTREKIKSVMQIKARGTVLENLKNGKTLVVEWENDFHPFEVDFSGGYWTTIAEVKKTDHIKQIWTDDLSTKNNTNDIKNESMANSNNALNQILFGPPGTGKTYNSISKAVELVLNKKCSTRKEYKDEFDVLRDSGQIEFVTFHQNYSYEDFVLGLKPNLNDDSNLSFKLVPGVFYNICKTASDNYLQSNQNSLGKSAFSEVFEEFKNPLLLDVVKEIELFTAAGTTPFWLTAANEYNFSFRKKSGGEGHTLSYNTIKDMYNGTRNYDGGLKIYYQGVINALNKLGTSNVNVTRKNYVIIIDEINRANISKVFGELITLLEEDKRIGADNELKITIPNTDIKFALPPNLYIIGTMNTADKSIALVDIALRRRFEFIGYYPTDTIIKELVDNQKLVPAAAKLLQDLNTKIYAEKNSADYLIGHAYFIDKGENQIADIIKNKIVPLLMEYFSSKTVKVEQIFESSDFKVTYNVNSFSWAIN